MITLLFAAAAMASSAPSPLAPLGSLVTTSDYPAGAVQRGVTGKVGFRLRIDATGKPDGCVVSQSSGSTELGNATCDLMLARARFKPASGTDGSPVRGDYQARIVWSIDDQPEAFVSEVIRVHSEIDAAGRVTGCTAVPAKAAAEFGGCTLFGDPRALENLVGRSLTGLAWVETRIIKQVSTDTPIADTIPVGAVKSVLAKSTVTITPAGAIDGCTNDVVTRFNGRPLNICQAAPDGKFAPAATSQPRHLTIILETVSYPR